MAFSAESMLTLGIVQIDGLVKKPSSLDNSRQAYSSLMKYLKSIHQMWQNTFYLLPSGPVIHEAERAFLFLLVILLCK